MDNIQADKSIVTPIEKLDFQTGLPSAFIWHLSGTYPDWGSGDRAFARLKRPIAPIHYP